MLEFRLQPAFPRWSSGFSLPPASILAKLHDWVARSEPQLEFRLQPALRINSRKDSQLSGALRASAMGVAF